MKKQVDYNIGIPGHYGSRNMGDEAIVTAVIENLRLQYPNAELFGFSWQPEDTQHRYDIPSYSVRTMVVSEHSDITKKHK